MTNTTVNNWQDWPVKEFLSYVTTHSRTPRKLFSVEMIERLHALAEHPIQDDLYTTEKLGNRIFIRLEETLADALVRAARIRIDDKPSNSPSNLSLEYRYRGKDI